jgi:hypothetical protein
MGFRFICPSTGHEIEAAGQVDDKDLMLRTENISTQCSFCGGSHEWVFVADTQANGEDRTPNDSEVACQEEAQLKDEIAQTRECRLESSST